MKFVALLMLASLVSFSSTDSYAQSSRTAVERFLTEFVGGGGNPDALEGILAEDYVLHTGSSLQDREGFLQSLRQAKSAAPDIQAQFKVLEYSGNKAILFEVIAGTHTGPAPLFGVEPAGHRFSFTNLHIFETAGDRITRHWAQPFLGEVIPQLNGQTPAKSAAEILTELEAALLVSDSACGKGRHDNTATWLAFRDVMQSLDASEETLASILTPSFRLSAGGDMNQTAAGVRNTFAMAGTIGRDHNNRGLQLRYVGEHFVAAFGPVRFVYDNPNGEYFLPPSSQPTPVAMNELQIIGTCAGKVFHQFSFADVFGLMAQISPQPRSRRDIAIDFLRLPPDEVRRILADDFQHESPVGSFDNADDFVAHFAAHEPDSWSVDINEIMETPEAVYLDYNFIANGQSFRMVDRLVIRDGLCREGQAFFLKIPGN